MLLSIAGYLHIRLHLQIATAIWILPTGGVFGNASPLATRPHRSAQFARIHGRARLAAQFQGQIFRKFRKAQNAPPLVFLKHCTPEDLSQLAPRRVQNVKDVVKEGDKVKVKLLGMDERGKVRLSMKVVDQTTGEDLEAKQKAERGGGEQHAAAGGGGAAE